MKHIESLLAHQLCLNPIWINTRTRGFLQILIQDRYHVHTPSTLLGASFGKQNTEVEQRIREEDVLLHMKPEQTSPNKG